MVLREPDWVAIAVVVTFWVVMTVDFTRRMAASHRRRRARRHAESRGRAAHRPGPPHLPRRTPIVKSGWTCPDCPAVLVDAPAALEHEQRLGHGVPTYQRPVSRPRPVQPVPGQLEIPLAG